MMNVRYENGMGKGVIFLRLLIVTFLMTYQSCQEAQSPRITEGRTAKISQKVEDGAEYAEIFYPRVQKKGSKVIEHNFGILSKKILMNIQDKREIEVIQNEQEWAEERFVQELTNHLMEESFSLSSEGKVDLLLVIDDSSSMRQYQDRLASELVKNLDHLGSHDWKLSVMTTTSPCLRQTETGKNFLSGSEYKSQGVQLEASLRELISVGERGNPVEKGVLALKNGATESGCHQQANTWKRKDSQHFILLVTDEENCGSATNEFCENKEYQSADYFFDNTQNDVTVFGLLLLSDNPSCPDSGFYDHPPNPFEYQRIIEKTGGEFAEICADSYHSLIDVMISKILGTPVRTVQLKESPELSSIQLFIDGNPVDKKLSVSERTLTLPRDFPVNGRVLTVSYSGNKREIEKEFQLSGQPEILEFEVWMNETQVQDGAYAYHEPTNSIIFSEAPAEHADILVRYRTHAELPRQFLLPKDVIASSVEIFIEGERNDAFRYEPQNGLVIFEKAPLKGEKVTLKYHLSEDIKTSFQIDELNATQGDIQVFDEDSGDEVEFSIVDDMIIFPENLIYDNRSFVVELSATSPEEPVRFSIEIPGILIDEEPSILVDGYPENCFYQPNEEKKDQTKIILNCENGQFEKIDIHYHYLGEETNRFPLNPIFFGLGGIKVYIDGKRTMDFIIDGRLIVIEKSSMVDSSLIKIEYYRRSFE